jgi:hypothetical protein
VSLRLLKIAAWTVFAGDALVVLVLLGAGLASTDRADPSMLFALIAAVPLGGLFALVFFGARRNGRVRLWLGLVLGAVPLFFCDRDDRRAARPVAAHVRAARPSLTGFRRRRGCAIVFADFSRE